LLIIQQQNREENEVDAANGEEGGGYDILDSREVEEARRRAQQPSEYAGLQ